MTALPAVTDLKRENVRLQGELRTARDRQDASSEILRTIANVSGDAEQSLQRIAEITARLFDAPSVTIRSPKATDGAIPSASATTPNVSAPRFR